MPIERLEQIPWHAEGTLKAVTRWISSHDEGIAELLKNTRRAYQPDRLDVEEQHRAALILLSDGDPEAGVPARIGVLDVGGATLEDVEAWSVWHDPEASRRQSQMEEEETQGNGGKAYLYALFIGQCRFLGISNLVRNCMGFEGPPGSEARGTPGWIPSRHEGREVSISSVEAELEEVLSPYGIRLQELPDQVRVGLMERGGFTLVEGVDPVGFHRARMDADDLITKVLRHEQTTLVVEQLNVFAIHNAQMLNEGEPLRLPPIPPYPGLEHPLVFQIPEELQLPGGEHISSTDHGAREQGRLTLLTSRENMYTAYRNLRPRWRIAYKTTHQVIGSKTIGEIVPGTSGAAFVYGIVELPALEPGYVETGRKRPKDGPLTEALDRFIADRIRDVAAQVNELRKKELDDRALDQVHEENRLLDRFKNSFLPTGWDAGSGSLGDSDQNGGGKPDRERPGRTSGTEPEELEYVPPEGGVQIARGVTASMPYLLSARVRDTKGHVASVEWEWFTSDHKVASIESDSGLLTAAGKGECEVWVRVKGTAIESDRIPVRVWVVEHVFLSPRELEIALGKRGQVIAEVTEEDGDRSTEVLLDWRHDADDPLIVRIGPRGWVTGNREGRTSVSAGAGDVWSRRPADITVTVPDDEAKQSGGFPELRLTDRDIDPATGQIREGNPDAPALWQETSDFVNNIWWLNLQSPEATFAFERSSDNAQLWRMFHVTKLMEMVELVWMNEEYTSKDSERPDYWGTHRQMMETWQVRTVQSMWSKLEPYVQGGQLRLED